jgi:nitroreductase
VKRVKQFAIGLFIFLIIVLVGLVVWDGAFLKTQYNINEDYYDIEEEWMTDIQFELIKAGIQSASSHNMQPWKIKILDQQTFQLYADMKKTLPVIDPDYVQHLLSQGTFIGKVKEVAKTMGVTLNVAYSNIELDEDLSLIATFEIVEEIETYDDFMASATKGTIVENPYFDFEKATEFINEFDNDLHTVWTNETQKDQFQDYLREGTLIESNHQAATEELLEIFRFTKWDKNEYRYGLSLNTMSPVMRTFIEPLIGATSNWKSFGNSSISAFEQRLVNEQIYLIISKEEPTAIDYIRVGEVISRLGLEMDGYTVRPAVQLLQPLEGMNEAKSDMMSDFNVVGVPMIILGFTPTRDSYYESLRHQVMDIIIK